MVVVVRVRKLHSLVGVVVDMDEIKRSTVVAARVAVIVVVVTITTAVRVASSTTTAMTKMTIGVEVEVLGSWNGLFRPIRPPLETRQMPQSNQKRNTTMTVAKQVVGKRKMVMTH
jgi:hypothetical protein